jgi:hypothetical protein
MKRAADFKQGRRAKAGLRADHKPRRLAGFPDPRLSPADERSVIEQAHRRNGEALRADLIKAIGTMTTEVDFLETNLGRVVAGDHRDAIRFARRAIAKLDRALGK